MAAQVRSRGRPSPSSSSSPQVQLRWRADAASAAPLAPPGHGRGARAAASSASQAGSSEVSFIPRTRNAPWRSTPSQPRPNARRPGSTRRRSGIAFLRQPADGAAGGLGHRRHHGRGGAHVGELDRGDRPRAGIGGVVAGGDAVDPVLLRLEAGAGDAVLARLQPDGERGAGGGGDGRIERLAGQRLALDQDLVAERRWRAAPPPRAAAPSSASGRGGAAGAPAARHPRSRAPTARHGRRAAARRGPRRRA